MEEVQHPAVIAFDLDGTLAESRLPITADMSHLLIRLAKEKKVIIISGGSFNDFSKQLSLFLDHSDKTSHENVILMPTNGSVTYTYDPHMGGWQLSDEIIFSQQDRTHIMSVLETIIESGTFDIPKEGIGAQIQDRRTQVSFSGLGATAPIDQKLLWDPNHEKRKAIVAAIEPLVPEASIFIAGTTTIDFLPKNITKGTMLMRELQKLGLAKEVMLFIGDALFEGGNDYEVAREGFKTIPTTGPGETAQIIEGLLRS